MHHLKILIRKSVAFLTAALFLFMPIIPSVAAACEGTKHTEEALLSDVPEIPHSGMHSMTKDCEYQTGHQAHEMMHDDEHQCEHSGDSVCMHAMQGCSITSCPELGESMPALITLLDLIPAIEPEVMPTEVVASIQNILEAVSISSSHTVYRPPIA